MDLKRNIIELKNEIDTKFDLAMSFANSEIVFTDIPFDEVNIQTISAIQNVIYYIKIIDINGSFNSSVFCQNFFKLKSNKKIKFPQVNSNNKLHFLFSHHSFITLLSQNVNYSIYIKSKLPKLPFFCSMEDKCRSKFNFFLKIRAGNDESYEKMIRNK